MRLAVDGDRIVEADAPGLARPLAGLTLLEAAAVPGETLAADALANALAQVFRAEPDPDRIAVAMSGGVDSAVALLRAGPKAIGVTLRLWLDPAGPDSERACCSPEAVIAARETCHALGLPHVTLDLREEFRRAVVDPFVAVVRARRDAEPVRPLQRRASASPSCSPSPSAPARPSSGRATTRGSSSATAGGCSPARPIRTRISRTCSRRSIPRCSTGSSSRSASRRRRRRAREAAAAGLDVAERRESQEACFLAGDDYRAFLERQGLEPADGRDRRRGRRRARPPRRRLALHAGPAARDRRRRGRAALRAALGRGHEHARRRPARLARLHRRSRSAASCTPRSSDVEAKLRYRSPALPARVTRDGDGFTLELDQPAYGVAPGQIAALYDDGAVVGCGVVSSATSQLGCPRAASSRQRGRDRQTTPSPSSSRRRSRPRVRIRAPGRNLRAPFFVHQRNGTRTAARHPQGRRERRQGERAAGQGGSGDGQRSGHGGQRGHGGAGREHGDHAPRAEDLRPRRGI